MAKAMKDTASSTSSDQMMPVFVNPRDDWTATSDTTAYGVSSMMNVTALKMIALTASTRSLNGATSARSRLATRT